ncbi:MAG: hypothetical protein LQ342_006516 [Letrouitia transgressa]|nr:MAG: hypothetical protein LQ342_006516 [Letrouitia transgressa]
MAPGLTEPQPRVVPAAAESLKGPKEVFIGGPKGYSKTGEENGTETQPAASHPNYLPVWDAETKYPPLQPFEHYEHGKDADSTLSELLQGATVSDITPNIGAEVRGIQLSSLKPAGKDQLALFVARKKVVDDTTASKILETRTNSITWHSDVTYENQPPGTTFLYVLDTPDTGGDTLFANQAEAYNRLSSELQKRLHGLKALHSGHEQAQNSLIRGSIVRREPVTSIHPLVRTHPVTGEKALYVNPQFTRYIIGYKQEESDNLLKFLYDHIAGGQDFQARVKWTPGTVVVWDVRVSFQHQTDTD